MNIAKSLKQDDGKLMEELGIFTNDNVSEYYRVEVKIKMESPFNITRIMS